VFAALAAARVRRTGRNHGLEFGPEVHHIML
jgi:hypothetical protein